MTDAYLKRQTCPAGSLPYIIRAGDTLAGIARDYNTRIGDIINANPGIRPQNLQIGQQICVPLQVEIYPSCPTKNYYIVRPGDTLQTIANYFNVTYWQLLYSNYGIDPEGLYVDQVLCIPVAPSPVSVTADVSLRRMVVYRKGSPFRTYSIATEDPAVPIPRGDFTVIFKNVDPGVEVGARWIGLTEADFGIRGINAPQFIQALSSGKSIIMTNEDVSELFNLVPVGTAVRVI